MTKRQHSSQHLLCFCLAGLQGLLPPAGSDLSERRRGRWDANHHWHVRPECECGQWSSLAPQVSNCMDCAFFHVIDRSVESHAFVQIKTMVRLLILWAQIPEIAKWKWRRLYWSCQSGCSNRIREGFIQQGFYWFQCTVWVTSSQLSFTQTI